MLATVLTAGPELVQDLLYNELDRLHCVGERGEPGSR
jgi:hypothetical protein